MNKSLRSTVFIFVALECEARPLVDFFALKKDTQHHAFSLYKNNGIILTVSGVGKTAMAGAVAYTMALYTSSMLPVVINIGIAGHKTLAIGHCCLAMKIQDEDTGRRFYPQFLGKAAVDFCTIKTVSVPSLNYDLDSVHDMESSAFYEMASRFSSSELIHCIKIVSDNENSSMDKINPVIVSNWIENKMSEFSQILNFLLEQQQLLNHLEIDEYNDYLQQWHFTQSGKAKLKALLKRWKVLNKEVPPPMADKKINAKDVLKQLEQQLDQLQIHL